MEKLKIIADPRVKARFKDYPKEVRSKLIHLRNLILETAQEIPEIQSIEETLKWGEPSYLVKKGSTIRIDWKSKAPNQYAIYFKCTSKLVPTFKKLYGDTFSYEKSRALLFDLDDPIPNNQLKNCIRMALQYHSIKHLPMLGYQ